MHILKDIYRRPKIEPTTNQPSEDNDVEVVKPWLTKAGMARWQQVQKEANSQTDPPITIRPKLRCSVTATASGKMVTIMGGWSDSDDDQLQ